MFIKILIFILLFGTRQIYGQECPPLLCGPRAQLQQFQANVVNLKQPQGPKTKQNEYNVTLKTKNFSRPYEIILAVSFIQNYFDPTALDFAVWAVPQFTYFKIVFAINLQANWTSVYINYITSSRQDFRVGFFILDKSTELAATNQITQRNLTLKHFFGVRKWDALSQFAIVKAYISGIKYPQRFIDLSFGALQVNTSAGTINITLKISNQKQNIQTLYIGYIIYARVNNPLIIQITNEILFFQKSLTKQVDNLFVGIIGLNSKKLQNFFQPRKRMLTTILQPLPSNQLLTKIEQFSDNFVQEGIYVKPVNNPFPIINERRPQLKDCTIFQGCMILGGFLAIQRERQYCIICHPYAYYDPNNKKCSCYKNDQSGLSKNCTPYISRCNKNQININGSCIKKTSQEPLNCSKNSIFNNTTKKCECKVGFISFQKFDVLICAERCLQNSYFDLNTQKYSNGKCIKCGQNSQKWDPIQKTCQCKEDAYVIRGKCTYCSENAYYDKNKNQCICKKGYYGDGVTCLSLFDLINSL